MVSMLSCSMGAITLGVVKSRDWDWASTPTEGAIIAGLAALTGFVLWAARVNAPALDRSAPTRAGRSVGEGSEMTHNPSWQLVVVNIAESTLSFNVRIAAARTPSV
jgi:hypothetical protein